MESSLSAKIRPTSVSELRSAIAGTGGDYPAAVKQILELAFRHPDLVAFGSASSVAVTCAVSPSTVMRAARHVGFDTFRDFRQLFRDEVRERAGRQTSRV
ncbi:MurR/RpiR family transcriptional regulator [Rhizobium bangladeshense]|uniref:MurR/RpiR family transcriptional regulator n=1 Tax=Rhizobium bangladeshense TaxID=1138189 RepID=UPI0007E53EAD|nr:MurR/RpiR family transcriptional regulator [Rhizobium bangladeshense]